MLVGGPAGGFLPPAELDTLYTPTALNEKGAIWGQRLASSSCGQQTCLVDMATHARALPVRRVVRQDHPVPHRRRAGCTRWASAPRPGLSKPSDPQTCTDLAADVRDAALCGLEYCAPNPFLSGMRYFADEFDAALHARHVPGRRLQPGACRVAQQ